MNKLTLNLFCALLLLIGGSTAYADGFITEIEKTIEEARIRVVPNRESSRDDEVLGTLTATRTDCKSCPPQTFPYTKSTRLINQFGAEKPIKELESWSGNRAMVRYDIESNQVKLVEILP